jgi:hypothetical protein
MKDTQEVKEWKKEHRKWMKQYGGLWIDTTVNGDLNMLKTIPPPPRPPELP